MDFLNNIYTTEDRDKLLYEIELFKRKDFKNIRTNSLEFLKTQNDIGLLKDKLTSLESLELVIALQPTPSIIDLISSEVYKHLKNKVVFKINEDSTIIGGLKIIYKGKYFDYSVLKLLN